MHGPAVGRHRSDCGLSEDRKTSPENRRLSINADVKSASNPSQVNRKNGICRCVPAVVSNETASITIPNEKLDNKKGNLCR